MLTSTAAMQTCASSSIPTEPALRSAIRTEKSSTGKSTIPGVGQKLPWENGGIVGETTYSTLITDPITTGPSVGIVRGQKEDPMYHLLNLIYHTVMDYPIRYNSLRKVCEIILRMLSDLGYSAEIEPGNHRDFRIISVDNHHFRIVRNPNWMRYDVIPID